MRCHRIYSSGLEPQVQRRKTSGADEPPHRAHAVDWPSSDSDDDRPLAVALGVKRSVAPDTDEAKPAANSPDATRPVDAEKSLQLENEHPADQPVQNGRPQPFIRAKLYSAPSPSSVLNPDKEDGGRQGIAIDRHSPISSNSREVKRSPPSKSTQMSLPDQEQAALAASPAKPILTTDEALVEEQSMETPGKSTDVRLQETLMRIGLQSILSPSKANAKISTQDVEAAALLALPVRHDAAAATSGSASELEAALKTSSPSPAEALNADASSVSEQATARTTAVDNSVPLAEANEEADSQSAKTMERIGPADVQEERLGKMAWAQAQPETEGTGMQQHNESSLPEQQPSERGSDAQDQYSTPADVQGQKGGHSANIGEGQGCPSPREGQALTAATVNPVFPLQTQHVGTAFSLSVANNTAEAAELRAIEQVMPAIIPDSEEEEEMAHS